MEVFNGSSAVSLQKSKVHSFEQDIHSLSPPSDTLSESSFVHSAAEIFKFLRDMALGISPTHSTSLLAHQHSKMAATSKYSQTHLVHPGALLCMVDLLPSVDVDQALFGRGEEEDKGREGKMEGREDDKLGKRDGVPAGEEALLRVPAANMQPGVGDTGGACKEVCEQDELLQMTYLETKKVCLLLVCVVMWVLCVCVVCVLWCVCVVVWVLWCVLLCGVCCCMGVVVCGVCGVVWSLFLLCWVDVK